MKYVIKLGCRKSGFMKWWYYNGDIYTFQDECFTEDIFATLDNAKRYPNKKAAEKAIKTLCEKCSNVDMCVIEEIEE